MPETSAQRTPTALADARGGLIAAVALVAVGAALWITCFVVTLGIFSSLAEGSPAPAGVLGVPWAAAGLVLFTALIGIGTVILAVRRASGPAQSRSAQSRPAQRRVVLGIFSLVAGLVGLWAAWALTADKVITVISPTTKLDCNYSLIVQCGANLSSAQGAIFGFPNPLLGLAGWAAVLVMGVALLLRAPVARWFRVLFAVGVTGAMALVAWLIAQSIFVLGTLCPWCLVTWAVTIPLFWATWGYVLSDARGRPLSRLGQGIRSWTPLLTVVSYAIVAVLAQLRLDFLSML